MRAGTGHIVFWTILVSAALLLVELCCVSFVRVRPDLFDQRDAALTRLQPEPFARFTTLYANRTLGWDHPAEEAVKQRSCTGVELTYTYGAARDRLHGSSAEAVVLVAGDSYTYGADVGDTETYPAALEEILGVATANLGVGGYDPIQALLKLEAGIVHFPKARVVVLSILDDDVYRMLNGYRPVLNPTTGIHFGLKPFWDGAAIRGLIGEDPFRDLGAMRQAAIAAFDNDYWRRPVARFPYALAVARMLTLPSFWVPQIVSAGAHVGYRQFELVYRIPSVQAGLRAIYARFANFAQTRGVLPVVAFIPTDARDQTSGLVAIAAASQVQGDAITLVNVVLSKPDRYYPPVPGYHPRAEGYRMIAESVSDAVRPRLAAAP